MASSDGAARFLGCGLCGTEWQTNRIRCPSCGETDPQRLPGWQSEAFPAARVEQVAHAKPYRLGSEAVETAAETLRVWSEAPAFA